MHYRPAAACLTHSRQPHTHPFTTMLHTPARQLPPVCKHLSPLPLAFAHAIPWPGTALSASPSRSLQKPQFILQRLLAPSEVFPPQWLLLWLSFCAATSPLRGWLVCIGGMPLAGWTERGQRACLPESPCSPGTSLVQCRAAVVDIG